MASSSKPFHMRLLISLALGIVGGLGGYAFAHYSLSPEVIEKSRVVPIYAASGAWIAILAWRVLAILAEIAKDWLPGSSE